jgi:hypothetical protein
MSLISDTCILCVVGAEETVHVSMWGGWYFWRGLFVFSKGMAIGAHVFWENDRIISKNQTLYSGYLMAAGSGVLCSHA